MKRIHWHTVTAMALFNLALYLMDIGRIREVYRYAFDFNSATVPNWQMFWGAVCLNVWALHIGWHATRHHRLDNRVTSESAGAK